MSRFREVVGKLKVFLKQAGFRVSFVGEYWYNRFDLYSHPTFSVSSSSRIQTLAIFLALD